MGFIKEGGAGHSGGGEKFGAGGQRTNRKERQSLDGSLHLVGPHAWKRLVVEVMEGEAGGKGQRGCWVLVKERRPHGVHRELSPLCAADCLLFLQGLHHLVFSQYSD